MKLFTFSLLVIAVVFSLGCSAENPVCTTNFCAIGEVFPRSELEDGQAFSEVDIDDSVIFATLVGATPIEATPVIPPIQSHPTTFANIVADAAAGGTKYVGQIVTITAPIGYVLETAISLTTKNRLVQFYVRSPNAPEKLDTLTIGKTYQFTLEITSIAPPDEKFDTYAVFSNLTDDATRVSVTPVETSVAKVVANTTAGGTRYVGQTIKVRATVSVGTSEIEKAALGLTTQKNDAIWLVIHTDKAVLDPYLRDRSYTFTLLIHSITPPDPTKVDPYYAINSVFVAAE